MGNRKIKLPEEIGSFYIYLGFTISRQSRSPRSSPCIRTSAVAELVAIGILCISQSLSKEKTSGS